MTHRLDAITKPAIQRLAFKAGVPTMVADVYPTARSVLSDHVSKVIHNSYIIVQNKNKNTIKEIDVRDALKLMGRPLVFSNSISKVSDESNRTVHTRVKFPVSGCGVYHVNKSEEPQEGGAYDEEEDYFYDAEGGAGTRRFHPGVVANRKVRFYQKNSGACFAIPKMAFNRLIKELAGDLPDQIRFSREAKQQIQMDAESYIVSLFKGAGKIAEDSKHKRVTVKDFTLVQEIRNNAI